MTMNRPHAMDCVDFKVLLSPYIDGELASEARFAADRHLIECRDCRDLLERAESNDETIRALCLRDPSFAAHVAGPVGLPSEFENAVLNRVHRRHSLQWRRMRTSLGLLAAAAAVALTAALWTIWPSSQDGESRGRGGSEWVDYPGDRSNWEPLANGLHGPPMRMGERAIHTVPTLSADESQAIHGTAFLLEEVLATPFENIASRDRLREMATYDELIARLGAIQPRLDTLTRRHVAAARAALFELQREHLDVAAWNNLQDDLRSFELIRELESIAATADSRLGA
ncbi:MAG: zf-HC2 domain-containing protein [Phycisphaerae bacterium]|nr:zf-HC2 domain-containing protein [Phycisphaerae bacterium]